MNVKNSKLQGLVADIGREIYSQTGDLPEEEKWAIQWKLRNRSSDVISWTAEGLGSVDPRDIKWAIGKARANLFAIEATYKHAAKIGLIKIDPDLMVLTSRAVTDLDLIIEQATVEIPNWFVEMDPPKMKEFKK